MPVYKRQTGRFKSQQMKKRIPNSLILFMGVFLLSCQPKRTKEPIENCYKTEEQHKISVFSETMSIWESDRLYHIYVATANQDSQVFLVPKNTNPNSPKIVALSSVFAGFLSAIHLQNLLVGVDETDYIQDSILQNRIKDGALVSVKKGGKLHIEKLVSIGADWLVYSDFDHLPTSLVENLKQRGTQFLECNNYKEESPLGRAEWIKVFGILMGKKDEAFALFDSIVSNYQTIANKPKSKPKKVLTGSMFAGFWNIPGAHTYTPQLIRDAGGSYIFESKNESNNYALGLEEVVQEALNAEIWINIGSFKTQKEMLLSESRYASFSAFKKRQLFNNNKQINSKGGNAFWETGPVRPDIILNDLYRIMNGKSDSLVYYQNLL